MPFDSIGLEKTGEGQFVIFLVDIKQLRNPFMESSVPLSKQEATNKLRELHVPESEIQMLFVNAEKPKE